jgi:hypothetical protein
VLALFFMLGWDQYGFDKKRAETRYIELLFLHSVGSGGHIVHSGASVAQNVITLLFMPGWDRYRFEKKRTGTPYAEHLSLHPMGSAGYVVHSGGSGP